jgi:hypothetical protein
VVTTKRGDGAQVYFTLYVPPGYQKGTRLPTVFWAYPLEYSDPTTAGQVSPRPTRHPSDRLVRSLRQERPAAGQGRRRPPGARQVTTDATARRDYSTRWMMWMP